MIEIIDNFLDQYYIDYLEELVSHQSIQWTYQNNSSTYTTTDHGWQHGFSHALFYPPNGITFDSSNGGAWIPAILSMEEKLIGRKNTLKKCRLDLTVKSVPNVLHTPHIDLDVPHLTTILYLNDSDGVTVIYNEKEESIYYTVKKTIEPKKNRLVLFDGEHYHTGHSPSRTSTRILLNSNFVL